ncbi:hypothetical protein Q5M87_06945 [Brachyspira innocens]|uniref:Uncharacterized protein n=1 Tax=Brachyspira innocens TaxID=13264 RepID=A0ABT8Z0B2_9SPIR|nr:hypothetical protein [Brachyspira innocens]MDO6993746.1 hypothetical protein [Brachyspira innocens]MDO7020600.1 hypothetical protein [Brachyspira innocens]
MECEMCRKYFHDEDAVELNFEYFEGVPQYNLCQDCARKVSDYIENYYKKKKEEEQIFYQ